MGHVDFIYEVSRVLVVCEGVFFVVDVVQGVEVQMVVNVYFVVENDLEVLLVFNKIDLLLVMLDEVIKEIEDGIGIDCIGFLWVFVKEGLGVEEIF